MSSASYPNDRDSDDDEMPPLAAPSEDDTDDDLTMKMSQYTPVTKKKVREATPNTAERIATGYMNSRGEHEYISYDPMYPDIPPLVEYVKSLATPFAEQHSFANASPLSEHVSVAKPRVVPSGSYSVPNQSAEPAYVPVQPSQSSNAHVPSGSSYSVPQSTEPSYASMSYGQSFNAHASAAPGYTSNVPASVPIGFPSHAPVPAMYGLSSLASVPYGVSAIPSYSMQQAYGPGRYFPQSVPGYPQGVSYTQPVLPTHTGGLTSNPFEGIPFTWQDYMSQAKILLRNTSNGFYEANRGRDIKIEVANVKSKAEHLLIASNVNSSMDSNTAMNVITEKIDQFLNANPELKSFTIFDIDLSMQSGLGYSIECDKRVQQDELNKLANLRDSTRDKMESDRNDAEAQKEARTAECIKEWAEERLINPEVKAMTSREYDANFKDDLVDRHAKVDYVLQLKRAYSERVMESITHKVAKIRKTLTILQYMSQLLDAYGFVLQALTVEVINAIKPFMTIIQEVSVQVTHPFSGRSSINPYLEGRISFMYQALIKGKEKNIGRTINEFAGYTSAATDAELKSDPMHPFNSIVTYAQHLKQSGAMQYFLTLDTISLCLILCKYKNAPLPVTTGIFNIVNEYEKKRKLNPGVPVGEFEMVNAVREFLKLTTTVQEFKNNRYAGKEVVDLTNSPVAARKQPIRPIRPNENAYAAQVPLPPSPNPMENLKRHVQTGPIGKHGNVKYYIGSRLVTYIALPTAREICAKCANDAAPQDHHSPRCYTKQCSRCKYFGHSARHCYHKI